MKILAGRRFPVSGKSDLSECQSVDTKSAILQTARHEEVKGGQALHPRGADPGATANHSSCHLSEVWDDSRAKEQEAARAGQAVLPVHRLPAPRESRPAAYVLCCVEVIAGGWVSRCFIGRSPQAPRPAYDRHELRPSGSLSSMPLGLGPDHHDRRPGLAGIHPHGHRRGPGCRQPVTPHPNRKYAQTRPAQFLADCRRR